MTSSGRRNLTRAHIRAVAVCWAAVAVAALVLLVAFDVPTIAAIALVVVALWSAVAAGTLLTAGRRAGGT